MTTSRLAQARAAVRPALKARLMISGPTGAGKTWTALKIADAWVASAECACMGTRLCYERWPGDPGEWCSVCVAEVAWCAWKMGALR